MARKNGGYADFAPIPVNGATLASQLLAEDVSVVGVDDSLGGTVPRNRLATVRFDMFQRGTRAFEEALKAGEPGYEVQDIRIPGTLIERSTVRDIR